MKHKKTYYEATTEGGSTVNFTYQSKDGKSVFVFEKPLYPEDVIKLDKVSERGTPVVLYTKGTRELISGIISTQKDQETTIDALMSSTIDRKLLSKLISDYNYRTTTRKETLEKLRNKVNARLAAHDIDPIGKERFLNDFGSPEFNLKTLPAEPKPTNK